MDYLSLEMNCFVFHDFDERPNVRVLSRFSCFCLQCFTDGNHFRQDSVTLNSGDAVRVCPQAGIFRLTFQMFLSIATRTD